MRSATKASVTSPPRAAFGELRRDVPPGLLLAGMPRQVLHQRPHVGERL
jgi:hypothetical protein